MKIIHYTTLEIGLNHIIQTMKLRFGVLSTTNDPHEYKKQVGPTGIDVRAIFSGGLGILNEAHSYRKEAFKKIKIGCFVDEPVKDWKEGESFIKPRMWAQYGGNHAGMAFVFNKNEFVNKCKGNTDKTWAVYGNEIRYDLDNNQSQNSQSKISLALNEGIDETSMAKKEFDNAKNYFYKKHKDWKDENEFRIIIYTETLQFEFIDISTSLEAIVLGDKVGQKTLDMMKVSFKNKGVDVYKLSYSTKDGYAFV
jgi:hypothetical protein